MSVAELFEFVGSLPLWVQIGTPVVAMLLAAAKVMAPPKDGGYDSQLRRRG
jgi:hypothetical protein